MPNSQRNIDSKVLEVQNWLLSEYNNTEYPEFQSYVNEVNFEANGKTGWKTMTALVYAFQYELNIDSPNGSFGPLTVSLAPNLDYSNANMYASNITSILKSGFWCAGYNPGYSDLNKFEIQTTQAINLFRQDIGLSQTGKFSGYLWKSLLSTDAFVTTWSGGDLELREVQQDLNGLNMNGYDFVDYLEGYIPTDGLGSRQLSNALIIYIQAAVGDTPNQVAPTLGPYTQNILRENPLPQTNNYRFIKLAGYMLRSNGYLNAPIDGYWGPTLRNEISFFQHDMVLPPTGNVDFSTWMAGLISYGNVNRPFTVCDTRFEITSSRLLKLRSMGIEAVGRYLTGGDFKGLRNDEVPRILNGNLGLIPIYQGDGTNNANFNYQQGLMDANEARIAADKFAIPNYSIIYFAVDYDPQGHEILEYIIPYFQGIRDKFSQSETNLYRIGIYGTRNVCATIQETVPEVITSYISNMSSGFSGNLGYKMPRNWNFDQFDEITIDDWGIDKVTYSGKFPFITPTPTLDNNNPELFSKNPIPGDDFSIQPEVEINFGSPFEVYSYVENIDGIDYYRNQIGTIQYGQYFTRMGVYSSSYGTRIIFTDESGLAAYGYVDNREFPSSEPPLALSDTQPFYCYNFDPLSNSLVSPPELYTSSKPIEFTVKTPLNYYSNTSYLGILPVGTILYIEKRFNATDGKYYGHSQAGVNYPSQMAFDKMKLPGGLVTPFDLDDPNSPGWVELGYSHGSLGIKRAIY